MKNEIYIKNLEKAIKEKYGEAAVQPLENFWSPEKEIQYKKQLFNRSKKIFYKNDKMNKNGYIVRKKLFTDKSKRTCSKCNKFTFNFNDNFYLEKMDVCFDCFIKYYDGRI